MTGATITLKHSAVFSHFLTEESLTLVEALEAESKTAVVEAESGAHIS